MGVMPDTASPLLASLREIARALGGVNLDTTLAIIVNSPSGS